MTDREPILRLAGGDDAAAMLAIIQAASADSATPDSSSAAHQESLADVENALSGGVGIIASTGGADVGALLIGCPVPTQQAQDRPGIATLSHISVRPGFRNRGVATAMVRAAMTIALDRDCRRLDVVICRDAPAIIGLLTDLGLTVDHPADVGQAVFVTLPARLAVPTAEGMHELGQRLAELLRSGDVLVLIGELGAGKTTLTQGIGAGLRVAGPVVSPTFVLSRVHRPLEVGRPGLVHVDAYRLSSAAELEDLDVEATLAGNVTIVEWGEGLADGLSDSRLDVLIQRSDNPNDEQRTVHLLGRGDRWRGMDLTLLGINLTSGLPDPSPERGPLA